MTEKQVQNAILREFGTRPDLRIWRANCGVARIGRRTVRFGIPGQADLTGIAPDGRRLEIEVKSERGRLSDDQERFRDLIRRFGGIHIVARSVHDVYEQLTACGIELR
ncbi:MAG TPA: VRR-NUC domain-containing protein [Phycisphaerae bacterium]|nr:VRR-NUC domain-containing protein [Phycisphaerae bacterium]